MTCSPTTIRFFFSLLILLAIFPVHFAKPTCIDVSKCLVLGTPEEEENVHPPSQLSDCHNGKWKVSLFYKNYVQSKKETLLMYYVTQLALGGMPESITISWTGNCCVRDASSKDTRIDYGLDDSGNSFGVTFTQELFDASRDAGFYAVSYAGDLPIVADAATMTMGDGNGGYCIFNVDGPDCSQCQTSRG